jgi:hypothetical protein
MFFVMKEQHKAAWTDLVARVINSGREMITEGKVTRGVKNILAFNDKGHYELHVFDIEGYIESGTKGKRMLKLSTQRQAFELMVSGCEVVGVIMLHDIMTIKTLVSQALEFEKMDRKQMLNHPDTTHAMLAVACDESGERVAVTPYQSKDGVNYIEETVFNPLVTLIDTIVCRNLFPLDLDKFVDVMIIDTSMYEPRENAYGVPASRIIDFMEDLILKRKRTGCKIILVKGADSKNPNLQNVNRDVFDVKILLKDTYENEKDYVLDIELHCHHMYQWVFRPNIVVMRAQPFANVR